MALPLINRTFMENIFEVLLRYSRGSIHSVKATLGRTLSGNRVCQPPANCRIMDVSPTIANLDGTGSINSAHQLVPAIKGVIGRVRDT